MHTRSRLALIHLVACHGSAPTQALTIEVPPAATTAASSTPTAAAACIALGSQPEGSATDIDGDGTPDLIVKGYRDVTIYLRRGDCFTLLAKIDPEGPVAFVEVIEDKDAGVRDLSIDTWLFHGDRKRARWYWSGHAYSSGLEEEIPGPRRPRHP